MSTASFEESVELSKAALAKFIPSEPIMDIDLEKCKAERALFIAKAEKVIFIAVFSMFAFGWHQFGF
ncbi:hypothetical protein LMH73_015575 [Vibrio splendidus]|nr:hypothetical protein [Vibrio splendidus]MCC4882915.1 hypothetical protein [Vibrio splendidus]